MKAFLAQVGAYIASLKPVIESFFVGLAGALLEALVSTIASTPTWNYNTVKAALIAAALNYITSKARREAFKKVVEPVSPAIQTEIDKG